MFDTLFCDADILTMDDEQPVLRGGFVGVQGGKIAYVGKEKPLEDAKRLVDCKNKVLMPGLINTHAHTAMCVMRGYADDYTLQSWLFDKVFPVEAHMTASEPSSSAFDTAIVMPRSLNDPVGFMPSYFT